MPTVWSYLFSRLPYAVNKKEETLPPAEQNTALLDNWKKKLSQLSQIDVDITSWSCCTAIIAQMSLEI